MALACLGAAAACGIDARGTLVELSAVVPAGPADASAPDAAAAIDASVGPSPFCNDADPTIVLCMQFGGAVTDDSAHAQAIEVTGPTTFVAGARGGTAVSLTDQTVLHVPHNPAWTYAGQLSVELWMKPAALPASGARAGLIDKNNSFGLFVQSDGRVTCVMGGSVEAPAGTAKVGQWTHIACVNGVTTVSIYVDGTKVADASAGAAASTTEVAAIGGNSPAGDPFVGAIDELRVTAAARTPGEIGSAMATTGL